MAEVKLVVKQVDEGSKNIKGVGQQLDDLLGVAKNVTAGMVAMGATFKKAFDLSREGANLNQLRDSFELMNEQVFKTPGLLDDMSAAARGTIKETDLMAGLLKLTAGASDELASNLAANAPQLLEIAKASNKLNPALGDTAFLYDSIATGIKRASPLILDNLGIVVKVGDANEKYAQQLGKTVEQLTAEEKQIALLNAVLESGDQLIQQVGGNVDSQADAWARLEVKVQESTDAFKENLADGLLPVISVMTDDYGAAAEQIIDNNVEMAKSFADLVRESQKVAEVSDIAGGFGTIITGTKDEVDAALDSMALQLARGATSFEEFEEAINSWSAGARVHFDLFITDQNVTIEQFYEQAQAAKQLEGVQEQLNEQMARMAQHNRDVAAAAEANSAENLAAAAAYEAAVAQGESYDRVLIQNYGHLQEAANAARNYSQALAGQLQNLGGSGDAISDMLAAQQQLTESQGEWVQATVSNAGKIGEVNAELARDLSDEQAKAMREILNTVDEGSAEWLNAYNALQGDLTKSQREALIAQRAELEAVGDGVVSIYTGSVEDAEAAQEAIDAANQALIESYRELAFEGSLALAELSPDPDAIQRTLDYAVAIGTITQEEADLRVEAAETRIAIEELNEMVVNSGLEANIAAEAFNLLTSGQADTAAEAVNTAQQLDTERQNAENLREALLGIPSAIETAVNVNTAEAMARIAALNDALNKIQGGQQVAENVGSGGDGGGGRAVGGPVMAGGMYQVGEANQPELLKQGGRLYLIPGDQGQVFSNSQSQGMMGGVNINGPLIGQVVQRPGESGQRFADRVSTMVVERIGSLK